MKNKLNLIIAILGISLITPLTSCEKIDDYDPYQTECQDCDDDNNNDGNGDNDDNNNNDDNQPPVAGADKTIYVDLFQFEKAYGQIETNGDRYINLYGNRRGVHIDLSTLEVYSTGENFITIEEANIEAAKNSYDEVNENLYYDHIQKIWIWVYNKEAESFMIEMQSISWTNTPSAKERFFDYEFEIKNESKELWFEVDGKTIAVVASLTEE